MECGTKALAAQYQQDIQTNKYSLFPVTCQVNAVCSKLSFDGYANYMASC
jgi:hypothetical protein